MKKLYMIIATLILGFVGTLFAADFNVDVGPDNQTAISGSVLTFSISGTNNTGFDSYLSLSFLTGDVEYLNATVVPNNNPSISMGIDHAPLWILSSGQTINVDVQVRVMSGVFNNIDVVGNISDMTNIFNVYTSAVANVLPISDVVVNKIINSNLPQLTGDVVSYKIEVQNIGSTIATGIKLVDVWPNNMLVFSNQGLIDGISQIPTIYNSIANNYLFNLNDILPGGSITIDLTGSYDIIQTAGQVFQNDAFVLVDSLQYDTGNDSSLVTGSVLGLADLSINVSQSSPNPSMSGDFVSYEISYQNIGTELATGVILSGILDNNISFISSSVSPSSQISNQILWNLGSLAQGANGSIVFTGLYNGGLNVGDVISNTFLLYSPNFDINTVNNSYNITGGIDQLSDMSIKLYANNLSNPSNNIDVDNNILAVSGDIVELEIVIINNGNMLETGNISISNLNGFVGYNGQTSWIVPVNQFSTQSILLTGIVGPQNFVSFEPVVNMNYNSLLVQDNVLIDEPLSCGDGLITQNEQCDINGQIGTLLPGQQCEEQNGQCVIITEDITNMVCMEYITDLGTGQQCMQISIPYQDESPSVMCESLESDYDIVIADEDGDGDMEFTCTAQNNAIANKIRIDCGNGDEESTNLINSLTYECEYEFDEDGDIEDNLYEVSCYVDGETNDNCQKEIRVDEGFYGICGDGTLDDGEECDLGGDEDEEDKIRRYLDLDEDYRAGRYDDGKYYCEDCRIREYDTDEFVYQPPQCLGVNTNISVMEEENMPFWWRLWEKDNMRIRDDYDCDDIDNDEDKTIIDKDSMECTFAIYNGVDYLQQNEDELNKFTVDCFEEEDSMFFDYFEDTYKIDFDKVSGKYVRSVNSLLDGDVSTYGEYKLVLEKVEYEYCDPEEADWKNGRLYEGVCEVDFTLTRPYIMQISTFGLDPVATSDSDFLKDFYDMKGERLVESTNINETIDVDSSDYGFDSSVLNQMTNYKSKYESLAILVDNNFKIRDGVTIGDVFNDAEVKKVPNQLIFFVKGNGELILKQLTEYFPASPFTIYVEGMDVIVEGSVTTNAMIITDQKIMFDDIPEYDYCQEGGQVVQGIFIAQGGFDAEELLKNQRDQNRCQWGSLKVKGVLIGDGIDNLLKNRRSHLNDWFEVDSFVESSVRLERRNEIFDGAALLIEYNPSLWSQLPPGAESFTETLDVYKN